jgi:hypothetical protein
MKNNERPGRFSTPIEDYMKEIRKVKTFAEFKAMETKYEMILDDAAEAYAAMTEETFPEFLEQLPKCFINADSPDELWLTKFSAIALPRLAIYLSSVMKDSGKGSGFIMNRYLDENLAEISDGKFKLK